MPKISIAEKHALTQEEAVSRIKNDIAAAIQANQALVSGYSDEWTDENTMKFKFKVFGFSISGTARSLPSEVAIDADLPLAAVMLKGTIETRLRDEMKKSLA